MSSRAKNAPRLHTKREPTLGGPDSRARNWVKGYGLVVSFRIRGAGAFFLFFSLLFMQVRLDFVVQNTREIFLIRILMNCLCFLPVFQLFFFCFFLLFFFCFFYLVVLIAMFFIFCKCFISKFDYKSGEKNVWRKFKLIRRVLAHASASSRFDYARRIYDAAREHIFFSSDSVDLQFSGRTLLFCLTGFL